MLKPVALSAAATVLVFAAGSLAAATEESYTDPAEAPPTCIRLNKIRSTEIIDRKHILFRLSNHEMYVNKLPTECAGLTRNGAFLNKVRYLEICDLGLITPLMKIGSELIPWGHCALGKFEWVAQPDLDALRSELKEAQIEPGADATGGAGDAPIAPEEVEQKEP